MKRLVFKIIVIIMGFTMYTPSNADVYIESLNSVIAKDGVKIGPFGNIFSTNYGTGEVYVTTPSGDTRLLVEPNNGGPAGMTFDSDNNLYVAMYNAGIIVRYLADGSSDVFMENIREPIDLGWDSQNALYVSHYAGPATVTKINPDGSRENFVKLTQIDTISSIAIDSEDSLYVTSYESGEIYKVTQSGNATLFAETGVSGIGFIRFDAVNNKFYATVMRANQLLEIDIDGNHTLIIDTPEGGNQDGPVEIATIIDSIGLDISVDGKRFYFASDNGLRAYIIADPLVDQLAPYFTGTPVADATEGSEYRNQFLFTDPNNDPLTLSFVNLPTWLQFDGVDTISGTPTSTEAGSTFTIEAAVTDGVSTKSQSYSLSVASQPAPQPTPPSTQNNESSGGGSFNFSYLLLLIFALLYRTVQLREFTQSNKTPNNC